MASTSGRNEQKFQFQDIKPFPSSADGTINLVKFLEATSDLIKLIDNLGKMFAPVKHDMERNIEKIRIKYKYDESSCLLELMHDEYSRGETYAIEGILWLNRALLFFELVFQEMEIYVTRNENESSMKRIFTTAYEGSIKKYHNWVTQQLCTIICKMSPTPSQVIKSCGMEDNIEMFGSILSRFIPTLCAVRRQIDDFFVKHNLFS